MANRSRLALATCGLLASCYSGADLGGDHATGSSTSLEVTTGTPDSGELPSTGGGVDDTGSAEVSSGAPDPSTGGDTAEPGTTTGAVDPPEPSTGGADETTGTGDSGAMPGPADVPDGANCAAVADWDPAWAQLEQDILPIVNQVRSQGADCGTKGAFGPTTPLTMHPALRCAARKHSADMAARNFFDHINPDGQTPWDRMGEAGYGGYSAAGENIAAGSPDAAGTMDQWMTSDGHCANIMNPDFEHIGVGYSTGGQYGHLWTQVFGAK